MICRIRSITLLITSIPILMFAGCLGSGANLPATVPAEGIVTLDGAPVEGGTILFIAEEGNYNASASSDKNGKFAMKAFEEKSGAVAGSYLVQISKTEVEKLSEQGGETAVNLKQGLPAKYATIGTSGLKFTVPEAGAKDIKFELKSK